MCIVFCKHIFVNLCSENQRVWGCKILIQSIPTGWHAGEKEHQKCACEEVPRLTTSAIGHMTPDGWLKVCVCVHAAICNPTASSTFASSCVGLMQPHHDTAEVSHWMVLAVSALEICHQHFRQASGFALTLWSWRKPFHSRHYCCNWRVKYCQANRYTGTQLHSKF